MRIFTKKKLEFKGPNGEIVITDPGSLAFQDVPDWVAKDNMFKWAKADGDITVIDNKKQQKSVEKSQ